MGWEYRGDRGPYYTRSRKVRGRIVREYVGGGLLGQMAARLDAQERERRLIERELWKKEREQLEEADRAASQFYDAVETLTRAALYAGGYHRHKHGEWRRRRAKEGRESNWCSGGGECYGQAERAVETM